MSITDPAAVAKMFGAVGQQNGIEVWRIEKLNPVRVPAAEFGSFHSGDCYIVLKTYSKSSKRCFDLHYWQGANCSVDERGASAIRAVELDDLLEGAPVQYRETQGNETPAFLALFPKGLRYLDGGVETAFKHVGAAAYTPKLYQLKGRRTIRSKQVPLAASSLNDGDVFLLDAGLVLYQFNGRSASRAEKYKALELATKIDGDERGGKASVVIVESGDATPDAAAFWKLIGGDQSQVQPAAAGGDDEAAAAIDVPSLWRISDDGSAGSPQMSEVARGKLTRAMLEEGNAMLLDAGGAITVWIGREASKGERSKAMTYAAQYQAQNNRPTQAPIMRLPSGGETAEFKSFFVGFDRVAQAMGDGSASSSNGSGDEARKQRQLDLGALLAQRTAAVESMLDDASGSVRVWRIENLQRVEVAPEHYGQFYSGDSFIVLYKYRTKSGRDSYVLYFWQGRESSTDEKGASALLTVNMAAELKDMAGTQVRVVQNKEPLHFLALFKGKMVVRSGGVAGHGGFNHGGASSSSSSDVALFHIRGTNAVDTRAVQVPAVASSLNSSDCFVLLTAGSAFEWRGRGSNAAERAAADALSRVVLSAGRKETDVEEGSEPAEFWSALGGQSAYPSAKYLAEPTVEPRLFEVTASSSAGKVVAAEVCDFAQSDLDQSAVYILDTGAEIAVWVGARAPQIEKDAAVTMAQQYVAAAPNGRSVNTPIFRVPAGAEPPTFTAAFRGWNDSLANDFSDPYEKKMAAIKGQSGGASSSSAVAPAPAAVERVDAASSASSAAAGKTYSLAELKSGVPAGVDAARKESYLSDADFKSALGVDRDAFSKAAGWKQAEMKKKAGIF